MTYDKETGDVTIHTASELLKKKKIIRTFDDVEKMKRELYEEQDLDEHGLPKDGADPNILKDKFKNVKLRELEETLDIDPSIFYAFTMDMMRVDVGLIIQRPPIFMRMREQDI